MSKHIASGAKTGVKKICAVAGLLQALFFKNCVFVKMSNFYKENRPENVNHLGHSASGKSKVGCEALSSIKEVRNKAKLT